MSSEDMDRELKALERELVELAQELSQARHGLAAQLEAEIKQELQDLYMEKARFKVQFSKGKFNREGNEQVEFTSQPIRARDFKPLVKVASGGELSRLMLAIKSAFSRKEGKTSIVFDEVDTGVSGPSGPGYCSEDSQDWLQRPSLGHFPSSAGHCDCRLSVLY